MEESDERIIHRFPYLHQLTIAKKGGISLHSLQIKS